METMIEKLKGHKVSGNREAFDNELGKLLPQLKRYVKNRLRLAKAKGKIKDGIYSADDIIAEVYMLVHRDIESVPDDKALRVMMFKAADEVLERLNTGDVAGKDNINIESIMEQELRELDEEYTVDAGGDLVMIEELDDISYHLDEQKPRVLILDTESEEAVIKALELENAGIGDDMDKRRSLGKAYEDLPELSRAVFDLYSHAKLSFEEIAEIKSIKVSDVEKIISQVRLRIKSLF